MRSIRIKHTFMFVIKWIFNPESTFTFCFIWRCEVMLNTPHVCKVRFEQKPIYVYSPSQMNEWISEIMIEWNKAMGRMFSEPGLLWWNPYDLHVSFLTLPLHLIRVWGMRKWMSGLSILNSLFLKLRCKPNCSHSNRHVSCALLHFSLGDNQAMCGNPNN